jgi:predicted ATPase
LEILSALVERPGNLVSKDELLARVWPETFVEESNLRVHIAALRRALGDGQAGNRYVTNVPGRGYCFVAPVSVLPMPGPTAWHSAIAEPADNLPRLLTRMVGRDADANALSALLSRKRLTTVVGLGGIGKTTLALTVARKFIAPYKDGVRFIDLGLLVDPLLVASALAFVFGLPVSPENSTAALMTFLQDKKMLLVLDSCEHFVEATAALVVDLLRAAPGLNILATSREPLRAKGEYVQRLTPLSVPPISPAITAAEALAFPAVQLFAERAIACVDSFELTDSNAPMVSDICRKLDGIALAIELAAGRIDTLGVAGLVSSLGQQFQLIARPGLAAQARHRTLTATFDWSYEYLPNSERIILRRLSVFDGFFTLESAAVVIDSEISACDVVAGIANLVTKSLVMADIVGDIVYYRLLDTIRAYARTKLAESADVDQVSQRHSDVLRDILERAGLQPDGTPSMRR